MSTWRGEVPELRQAPPPDVVFRREPAIDADAFIDIARRSGLADRRPVDDRPRIEAMVARSDLLICARDSGGRLLGLSRSLTDFAFTCYLADLAVDRAVQGRGIGRELLRRTREAAGGEAVTLLLLSAPAALDYYPKVGLQRIDRCFGVFRGEPFVAGAGRDTIRAR